MHKKLFSVVVVYGSLVASDHKQKAPTLSKKDGDTLASLILVRNTPNIWCLITDYAASKTEVRRGARIPHPDSPIITAVVPNPYHQTILALPALIDATPPDQLPT